MIVCIASLMMVLLLLDIRWYKNEIYRMNTHMSSLDKEFDHKLFNWSDYLEKRLNRLAQTQDEYQISTSRRMEILEERIKRLENKHNNKNK